MAVCLGLPKVANPTLAGGLSLKPPPLALPSLSLLCCKTPPFTLPLPGIALSGSVALIISTLVEEAGDAAMAYLAEIPLPCLKDPPPADEI